ncbi:MAG: TetR/AcrR family transcriptional regulator [Pseudomonadota bacterium]
MKTLIQKRAIATRAKLIDAANKAIAAKGYGALRVEDVVQRAGVAKGTFFAHFRDKDALMDIIIGNEIDRFLDQLDATPPPGSVEALIDRLTPLTQFMTHERYVFDVILRHSGAAASEEVGPIAKTFERYIMVLAPWLATASFRKDVDPWLLAEGVQALGIQCMALHFCAIHKEEPMRERMNRYFSAWLCPSTCTKEKTRH